MIGEDGPPAADGIGGNRTVVRKQAQTGETFRKFSRGLFSYKLVSGMTPPEINAAHLKEFTGSRAKKLDECAGIAAFGRLGGHAEKKLLEGLVGTQQSSTFRRRHRVTRDDLQNVTADWHRISQYSQVVESIGKLSRHLILSQGKWGDGCQTMNHSEKNERETSHSENL